ncbi:hypothetical protein [Sagittula salina]|uniref:Uncharacterized protein n=1 Tax=Sagittula salina TaxID=2820268 RepID=A0A940S4F9_9RHOB|nr:hypothetical protein [Sagittula salina]MBP0484054.1 hypothetical protein [Sagittula salina]
MMTAQDLIRPDGTVVLDTLQGLRLTEAELAGLLGVSVASTHEAPQLNDPASQRKLRGLIDILARIAPWPGSMPQTYVWFTSQPPTPFGDQTADELVRDGALRR